MSGRYEIMLNNHFNESIEGDCTLSPLGEFDVWEHNGYQLKWSLCDIQADDFLMLWWLWRTLLSWEEIAEIGNSTKPESNMNLAHRQTTIRLAVLNRAAARSDSLRMERVNPEPCKEKLTYSTLNLPKLVFRSGRIDTSERVFNTVDLMQWAEL
jgi:hypothetical protein